MNRYLAGTLGAAGLVALWACGSSQPGETSGADGGTDAGVSNGSDATSGSSGGDGATEAAAMDGAAEATAIADAAPSGDAPAEAAPVCKGELDPSFGDLGVLQSATPPSPVPSNNAMVLQPDGRIVVLGYVPSNTALVVVGRYNPDGSPDTTFGSGGFVTFSPTPNDNAPTALALQPDGRIVVGGTTYPGGLTAPNSFLFRLDSVGGLDTSFGTAGIASPFVGGAFDALVVRPTDGSILAIGATGDQGTSTQQVLVAQYTSAGTLDTSFGNQGSATVPFAGNAYFNCGALQPDGMLVVAGEDTVPVDGGYSSPLQVARFTSGGALDPNFGTGGLTAPLDLGPGTPTAVITLVVQSTGGIVASLFPDYTSQNRDFYLARFTPAGQLDSTFGTQGVAKTPFAGARSFAQTLSLLPGDALIAGGVVEPLTDAGLTTGATVVGLARYTANGAPDTTFGSSGMVVLPLTGQGDFAVSQVLLPDQKVLIASSTAFHGADGALEEELEFFKYCP